MLNHPIDKLVKYSLTRKLAVVLVLFALLAGMVAGLNVRNGHGYLTQPYLLAWITRESSSYAFEQIQIRHD